MSPSTSALLDIAERNIREYERNIREYERNIRECERNIREWFGGKLPCERYERDISHDRFAEALAASNQHNEDKDSINLVLLLGDTPTNFRRPRTSSKQSITAWAAATSCSIPPSSTRQPPDHFSFNTGDVTQSLPPQYKLIVDLLGISESCYEIEMDSMSNGWSATCVSS